MAGKRSLVRALAASVRCRATHRTARFCISKTSPSVSTAFRALNALTLYIDAGELRCIIGPNGAGKTTMMDVITGKTRPDAGSAWFGQTTDLLTLTEPEIAEAGVGRKFQKPTVFEQHTVLENLELAVAGDKSVWHTAFKPLNGTQRDSHR